MLALAAWMLALGALAKDEVRLLDQHPWRACPQGSWVQMTVQEGAAPATTLVQTLLEVEDDFCVVRSQSFAEGLDLGSSERREAYARHGFAHLLPQAKVVGSEKLVLLGTRLECAVWAVAWRDAEGEHEVRTWVAAGVETPLRFVRKDPDLTTIMTLTARHEDLRVGKERIDCDRYEGTATSRSGELQVCEWRSSAVPGGVVQIEARGSKAGSPWQRSVRTEAFRVAED